MTEDEHQEKIFEWAQSNLKEFPFLELLYANMNGVRRSKRYTAKLKRRGMKSGIPDMFLPVSRYGYHGLYIELKRPRTANHGKGVLSPTQKHWKKELVGQGYYCATCYGHLDAEKLIRYYLTSEKD